MADLIKALPTDDDILAVISERGGPSMTYVIRNWLRSKGFRVETPWVLRQMKRLERAGRVQRVPTSYAVQICWRVAP
jgi:hypothetical protein